MLDVIPGLEAGIPPLAPDETSGLLVDAGGVGTEGLLAGVLEAAAAATAPMAPPLCRPSILLRIIMSARRANDLFCSANFCLMFMQNGTCNKIVRKERRKGELTEHGSREQCLAW